MIKSGNNLNIRIRSITGLEDLEALEELYVADNGLENTKGMEQNTNIVTLEIANNQISNLDGKQQQHNEMMKITN